MLFTAANGDQGLAADGTHFYFGHDNGVGVDGRIYKYTYAGATVTDYAGPEHCQTLAIRADHDTLLAGGFYTLVLRELDKGDGSLIRSWDFAGTDYDEGMSLCYKAANTILIFTSTITDNMTNAVKIREITLADDGTFVLGDVWSHASYGVTQGLAYKDGHLWLIADNVATHTGTLYKLLLNVGGSITTVSQVNNLAGPEEIEGLAWDGARWYFGTYAKQIRRLVNNP